MSEHPSTDGIILRHATLAALTPLIPLPFVDTMARNRVMRRMVRTLAELHRLRIWDAEVEILADAESKSLLLGFMKGAILAPIKAVLRKTFMVLAGKYMVDLASRSYHHGYLVERAFAHRWCTPAGKRTPGEVRAAIDRVLAREPVATSPVTRAIALGYHRSQRALADLYLSLRGRVSGRDAAIEDAAEEDSGIANIIASLSRALTEVPREHFEGLERSLRRELFGHMDPEIMVTASEVKRA